MNVWSKLKREQSNLKLYKNKAGRVTDILRREIWHLIQQKFYSKYKPNTFVLYKPNTFEKYFG